MGLPTSITAGESLTWTKELSLYPASDGWAVTYHFRGPAAIDATGVDAGAGVYEFAVAPIDTNKTPGRYDYQAFAKKGITDAVLVASGVIEIKPNLVGLTTYDGRSAAEATLDAITQALKGVSTDAVQSYMIQTPAGSREVRNFSLDELMNLHKYFTGIVAAERRFKAGKSAIKFEYLGFGKA